MNNPETTSAPEPAPSPEPAASDAYAHEEELFRRRHEAADALAETLIELWIADHHARTHRASGSGAENASV